ncbi:ComF family protein [Granulicella sibirica]|nr:ComF family protein [Granulicella sibirica]
MAWRAVSRVLRSPSKLVQDVVTTVFPGDCRVCGGPLLFLMGGPVCLECVGAVEEQRGLLCDWCGEALGMESERFAGQFRDVRCSGCRMAPPDFVRAVAHGVYEDELRRMVHLLKYDGVRSVAPVLGAMLARTVRRLELGPGVVVVAVPLFPAKERVRGYNQAVVLADAALRGLKGFVTGHSALRRVKNTESQFALTPRMRRMNLRGAFVVADAAKIAGREVLLVDDIYTTGATARECARVLMKAGAGRVWVATLARAQTEGVAAWDGLRVMPWAGAESLQE